MDELHGILTAYEFRIGQNRPSRKDATFKASKEWKKSEVLPKNHLEKSDNEEALFIKKLKKGIGKYKGKLPLKCFDCRKIGQFASKCPYSKQDDSDDGETSKKSKKRIAGNKKNFNNKKNTFYSMENSEDEETSDDEET